MTSLILFRARIYGGVVIIKNSEEYRFNMDFPVQINDDTLNLMFSVAGILLSILALSLSVINFYFQFLRGSNVRVHASAVETKIGVVRKSDKIGRGKYVRDEIKLESEGNLVLTNSGRFDVSISNLRIKPEIAHMPIAQLVMARTHVDLKGKPTRVELMTADSSESDHQLVPYASPYLIDINHRFWGKDGNEIVNIERLTFTIPRESSISFRYELSLEIVASNYKNNKDGYPLTDLVCLFDSAYGSKFEKKSESLRSLGVAEIFNEFEEDYPGERVNRVE